MSYFDDASLVMIPSGYKTSKVYSVKPTDGSGDLTFSRSNDTATRVNSAGLIEKVRTNLVTYSNGFSNAAWAKSNFNLTGGQSDPFGGSNAWKAECTSTSGGILQTVAGSGIRVVSVYAKAGNVSTFSLWRGNVLSAGVSFNLANGTIISGVGTITSVGGGWYRCSTFGDTADVNPYFNTPTSGDFIYLAFSQLENGDVATDYIATTSAAVSVGPVANVPRLDYLNSSCPRLLLEPQRTNSVTYSEQLNNVAWNNVAAVTANTIASPDGSLNADTVTGIIYQFFSSTAATTFTFSVFAKKNSGSTLTLRADATSIQTCSFNLDTLVTGVGGTITNYGNGWYRCAFTFTANATATSVAYILPPTSVYLYGCQLEQGAYATSYIPTLGAAVTRGADAASKTGISSLIGQTEGTLFVDFTINALANFGTPISVNDGSTSNYIWLTIFSNGNLRAELNNGTVQAAITYGGAVVGGRYKMAFGYKTNDFVLYVNGTQVGTDNSGTTFSGTTLSRVDTNLTNAASYSTASESINQTLVFKTRLSNADLAALTA